MFKGRAFGHKAHRNNSKRVGYHPFHKASAVRHAVLTEDLLFLVGEWWRLVVEALILPIVPGQGVLLGHRLGVRVVARALLSVHVVAVAIRKFLALERNDLIRPNRVATPAAVSIALALVGPRVHLGEQTKRLRGGHKDKGHGQIVLLANPRDEEEREDHDGRRRRVFDPPPVCQRVVELFPIVRRKAVKWPSEHGKRVEDGRQKKKPTRQEIDPHGHAIVDERHIVAVGGGGVPFNQKSADGDLHTRSGAILVDALAKPRGIARVEGEPCKHRVHDEAHQVEGPDPLRACVAHAVERASEDGARTGAPKARPAPAAKACPRIGECVDHAVLQVGDPLHIILPLLFCPLGLIPPRPIVQHTPRRRGIPRGNLAPKLLVRETEFDCTRHGRSPVPNSS